MSSKKVFLGNPLNRPLRLYRPTGGPFDFGTKEWYDAQP